VDERADGTGAVPDRARHPAKCPPEVDQDAEAGRRDSEPGVAHDLVGDDRGDLVEREELDLAE